MRHAACLGDASEYCGRNPPCCAQTHFYDFFRSYVETRESLVGTLNVAGDFSLSHLVHWTCLSCLLASSAAYKIIIQRLYINYNYLPDESAFLLDSSTYKLTHF